MSNPINDKAEVVIDFPNKFYHGTFGRGSSFNVKADAEGVHVHLDRTSGEKRHVTFHIQYALLADLLTASAEAISNIDKLDAHHKKRIREAAQKLLEIE